MSLITDLGPIEMGQSLEEVVLEIAEAARPAERLTVSQAAAKYRKLNNPGAYVGPWLNESTPYLVEPMDVLASTSYTGMIFCGPAQCGKTEIFLNWDTYTVKCDPADLMLIQTSQTSASDFAIRRIDRLHRDSPEVGAMLLPGAHNDGMFRKLYKNGMMLTLSWPSNNELAGKPIPRLFLTDYDRMPQDVGGEGSPYDLASKRSTTFNRNAMCAAESSPSFVITDPSWKRKTPHEAPPTEGILSLYNRGDRRLWHWRCVSCHEAFEPDFKLLHWPESEDIMESVEGVYLGCPHCGQIYHHGSGDVPGKNEMNQEHARWIIEGQYWDPETGEVTGKPTRSRIASFWLKGVAARFQRWDDMVFKYLKALEAYERTQDEEPLKTTVNTDQGLPYLYKVNEQARLAEDIKDTAYNLGMQVVPREGRFLIATVDVQKNRFVVQIQAIAPGNDIYIVDRFEIKKSRRVDGDGEHLWVNPGAYPEDWDILVDEVLLKTYPLQGDEERHMAVKMAICDSGGKAGVTKNAYDFYRRLRSNEDVPGLHNRFQLIKGSSILGVPRFRLTYPDSGRKDRNAGARGEVPVGIINTNALKDSLDHMLNRTDPGGGKVHFPDWLDDNFYKELCVEIKLDNGKWDNPKNYRNESWDLLVYTLASLAWDRIGAERATFWERPPTWAEDWDCNSLVFSVKEDETPLTVPTKKVDLKKLGSEMA